MKKMNINSTSNIHVKNLYMKGGLKRSALTVKRKVSLNPSVREGGIRAALKVHLSNRAKDKVKQVPRHSGAKLIKTLDRFHEDEAHEGIQSFQKPRDAYKRIEKGYKQISNHMNRAKRTTTLIRSGRGRHTISAFRKIKGLSVTATSRLSNNVSTFKILSSKFVSKSTLSALPIKTGYKKMLPSSPAFLKQATLEITKQVTTKLVTAVAANPKGLTIAAVTGILIFLLMSVSNGFGGSTSSAGSFFMTDGENAKQYKQTVDDLNTEFQQRISDLQSSGYDDTRIEYMNEDGVIHTNWVEIFAMVAVEYEQDLDFSEDQKEYMTALYDQFNSTKTREEQYTVSNCTKDKSGKETCHDVTKKRLIIQIYSYDMEDVFLKIGFNDEQQEWARRLVTSGAIQEQFPELDSGGYTGGGGGLPGPGSLTSEELADLMEKIGSDVNKARTQFIETAVTLEGKVRYFWGGKSGPGWNNKWGSPVEVTAPGSEKTGTLQPYGLDCSGFVDWAFKSAGLGNLFSAGGTSYQWSKTYSITMDELLPGDLIFKNPPGQGGINHIGIFIGRDSKGSPIYVHCQGGTGVIVNGYKGFKYPRRPLLFQ